MEPEELEEPPEERFNRIWCALNNFSLEGDGNGGYLYRKYLETEMDGEMFDFIELFPGWIQTFLNGRTSIYKQLYEFTIPNLEKRLDEAENLLGRIQDAREKYLSGKEG